MSIWSSEIKELERLYDSFKGQFPELGKELLQLIRSDDPNVILLYSRRCLEVIITDLCECELRRERGTEPLKGIIDKLNKEKKIPAHIASSMHGLNELSTFGTHPKDFDPEQVKPVLVNLDIIIKWYVKYKSINSKPKEEKKIPVEGGRPEDVNKEVEIEPQEKHAKLTKNKLLSGILIMAILVITAILLYPKIFESNTLDRLRSSGEKISIAVMPFQNITGDSTKNIMEGWIQDNLINLLTNSEELKVKPTESINSVIESRIIPTTNASITPSLAGLISRKLETDVFIYGSIKIDASIIRITAQLIDTKTEEIFKNFQIDIPVKKDITNKIIDSLSLMVRDYLEVSKLKKESPSNLQGMLSTINSPEAYRYFMAGKKAFEKRDYPAVFENLTKAIEIDTNFTYAPILLAQAYGNVGRFEDGKKIMLKQYGKRDLMSYQMKTYTDYQYAGYFGTPFDQIGFLKQLLEIDKQSPDYHYLLGNRYLSINQYYNAIPEFEEALEINYHWGSRPWWIFNYTSLGYCYHMTGQYKKEKTVYKKAEKDFPDDPSLLYNQAVLSLTLEDMVKANVYIEKYKSILKENSASDAAITSNLADIYREANLLDKAEEYYRQAFLSEPQSGGRMNTLAYFLIDTDRNINEGLELVDKALILSPENYNYLHTKGWGIYKQGKFKEALDILQKSWEIRIEKAIYNHEAFLHLEEAKKAVAGQD
ncbi:MAG: hypothetical protein JXB49_35095 [Bacteroidales bacterium]|nr:hypothetical protein [Bacteroidales bacterium]